MEAPGPRPEDESGNNPNFVLPHRDAITEENWPEWEARGVWPEPPYEAVPEHQLAKALATVAALAGAENTWTGHAFDLQEGRPLADKPGTGIYTNDEGHRRAFEATQDFLRGMQNQESGSSDPDAS